MQIFRRLNALTNSMYRMVAYDHICKKIAVSASVVTAAMTLSNIQIPNAYAHVSHVLTARQYTDIKSGYPDIEITAAAMTGLIVVCAIIVQSLQKSRRISLHADLH